MIRVQENKQFNGVEVYFDTKPQQNIITALKERFFRWHTAKKCWYAKATANNLQFINNLLHTTIETTEQQAQTTATTKNPQSQYKYVYSGIYTDDGEYIKGFYGIDEKTLKVEIYLDTYDILHNLPEGTTQKNDSDIMTDYFDQTSFYITPNSKEYLNALEGYKKMLEHREKIASKRKYYKPQTEEQKQAQVDLIAKCEEMARLFITDKQKATETYNNYLQEQEEKQRQAQEQQRKNDILWFIDLYQKEKNGEKQFFGKKEIFENDTYIISLEKQEHYIIDFTPNCMNKPITEYNVIVLNKIQLEKESQSFNNEEKARNYIKEFIKD